MSAAGPACPHCKATASTVRDSRKRAGKVRRRRACEACGAIYATEEKVVPDGVAHNKRRGYVVPPAKLGEWDFLVNKKHLPMAQAAALLKIGRTTQ